MPHSDDSNQELAPVMHFQQASSLSSSLLSLGRQGRWMGLWGQDTVREDTFLGVFNVSLCALGAQLGLDMFAGSQCFCFLDFHQISWFDDHNTMHNVCQICTSGPIIGNKYETVLETMKLP